MSPRRRIQGVVSALIFVSTFYVGVRPVGPLPPLGPILNPYSGVWAVAATADLPEREQVTLPGIGEAVRVVIDDRGVPHIFASNSEDAARALGYVVARDRLFQMEMRWRSAAGRLSEIVGDGALGFDRYMRSLALAWSAEREFSTLDTSSPGLREVLAYAEGVNAWIERLGRRQIPLEYRLLGARPQPWRPAYSLYLIKLMGWDLTYGTAPDLPYLRLAGLVGHEAAEALLPVNSPIQQPIQPNGSTEARFDFATIPPPGKPDLEAQRQADILELARGPDAGEYFGAERFPIGSNNWVVAAGRTAAGYPLLSGDPHLELSLPSIWYEVHTVVPGDLDAYGVTIPSLPAIVLGFNRDVAWSFTNTGADIRDYYEEELDDPNNPSRYLLDGEWRPLDRRVEEYRGRGGSLLATDTLYFTHRGPLVERDGRLLSMRWVVLEAADEADALRNAARARNVEQWLHAMAGYAAPAQNMVLADRGGTIAIRSIGKYPLHPDGSGLVIRDGRSRASDWTGFWPPERYPFGLNPKQGYLASANQQPIDPQVDPTYLGADWPSPWRAMRINQLLSADSAVTPDAMRRFQTDPGNARADMFVPFFIAAAQIATGGTDGLGREAARLLEEWDRKYTKENERAVLFEHAMDELVDRTWDELEVVDEENGRARRVATPATAVLASLLPQPESAWWDDGRTADVVESRDDILVASLVAGLEAVKREHGEPGAGGWRWDGIRHANIYHLLQIPSLSALELPIQGGSGNLNPSSGRGVHGASWRMVVELGPEVRAWSIYPGGQSGNPMSSFYTDRIEKWVEGKLDRVLFPRTPSDLDPGRIHSVLILEPD